MDTNADCFYQDRRRLAEDLATTVNFEILALVEAGCRHIQVDEPLFARQVGDAQSFGFEMLERCFNGVPKEVCKIVHICCGYPNFLDEEDYKKADPDSYHQLAKEMEATAEERAEASTPQARVKEGPPTLQKNTMRNRMRRKEMRKTSPTTTLPTSGAPHPQRTMKDPSTDRQSKKMRRKNVPIVSWKPHNSSH